MADVKNPDEPTLPIKRPTETTPTIPEPKKPKLQPPQNDVVTPTPQQQEEVAKDEEEQQEEEEGVNGKAVIDRKGKGILIEEDDGEEEDGEDGGDDDSDSDSDSDSGIGDALSDDSDFADDPLAEVDLDNILPSRTRRKMIHPGVYLANDLPPEDSDESDDPDA
ncbi:hypothetical protein KSS87_019986 [Heliosperma pusillum]|nr:hypothetical protein KSS87_019986 [Heliosperma pusillum]